MGQERASEIESMNSFSNPATGRGAQDSAIDNIKGVYL